MKAKRIIFWSVVSMWFLVIALQNIFQCAKSHNDLYNAKKENYASVDSFLIKGNNLLVPFDKLQIMTGTNTAYGFYAPQVCGHLEPFFQVYEDGEKVLEHYNLSLKTSEASMRFAAVFGGNLERIDEILDGKSEEEVKSTVGYRLLDLKMHALSTRVRNLVGIGDKIEAGLYLYSTSGVTSYCTEKNPLQPSFHKTITYNYEIN